MGEIVSFTGYTPPARYDSVAWEQVEVDEAETAAGPWTLIDTIAFDDVDDDPTHPAARSFTTENGTAPDLWYRLRFLDGNGGQSNPTVAVRNSESGPPARFATADDLATRLGLDLSDAERIRADRLLELASGLIQDAARQTIELVAGDVLTLPGTNDETIHLPQKPVASVEQVTIDGVPLVEGTDWYLDGNVIVRRSRRLLSGGIADQQLVPWAGFGWPGQTIRITYTHGYAEIPESVKAICLEAVVRVWVNPGAVAQERAGDSSTLYTTAGAPSGLLLTDTELRAIRRLFGRKASSVAIGR
jgi:hypothetical protein